MFNAIVAVITTLAALFYILDYFGFKPKQPLWGLPIPLSRNWKLAIMLLLVAASLGMSGYGFYRALRPKIVERVTEKIVEKPVSIPCPEPPKESRRAKSAAPSQQQSGKDNAQAGPITQGPCSNVQLGGSNNQATTNCAAVRSLTPDEKAQFIQNVRQSPGTVTVWAVETGQSLGGDIYDALHAAGWQMQESEVQMMFQTEPQRVDIIIFVPGEPGDTGTAFSISDPSTLALIHSIEALKRFKWGLGRSEKVPKGVIKIAIEAPVT